MTASTQLRADRSRWALVAVSLATFMTYLDNNIVNVAIPSIQRSLHLSSAGIEWVVSAYILSFAALMLVGGRLADAVGRRRIFVAGLTVFTAASLAAGLAGNAEALITARAVQGVGAALVTPTTLAIITATFSDVRARNAAIATWGAVGALSLAVGPILGGLLSEYASWGWIFIVNVPVGVATLALAVWAIEESRDSASHHLDVPGLVLSSTGLTALTYALIEGHQQGWTSTVILGSFAVAAAATLAFVVVESRAGEPMVDLALFRQRAYTGGLVSLMLWAFGLFGIYFFTSIYMQQVLGFSSTEAGLTFVPMALCMATGAALSDRVAARFGAHRSVSFAMSLMGVGIGTIALLGEGASWLDLMPSFLAIGIGGGLTIPLTATVISAMPAGQAGVGSAVFNASRELSGLLGITVIGAILLARQSAVLGAGTTPLDAFLSGYRLGLVVAAALVVAGGLAAWFALRRAEEAVLETDMSREPVPEYA
jgi:EmrB/QacA subfamily drug resistance transporter